MMLDLVPILTPMTSLRLSHKRWYGVRSYKTENKINTNTIKTKIMALDKQQVREVIAKRVALELKDGDVVNLGIGLPTMVPSFLPQGVHVMLQSENGMIGLGATPEAGQEDPDWINAGGGAITTVPGAATFDSATSFGIIRGGHVDVSVLGALEVDEEGDLANWIIPGKRAPGMGGAMDLLVGTKKVILAMEHTAKGNPKILKKCRLPLTAKGQVDMIVTEMCVIEVRKGKGLWVTEIYDGVSREEIQAATEAELHFDENVQPMKQ